MTVISVIVGEPEGVNAYEFSMFLCFHLCEPIRNTEIWILSAILDDLLHMYRVLVATGLLSRDACSCCTALTIGFFK